jgi:hypothetical protein
MRKLAYIIDVVLFIGLFLLAVGAALNTKDVEGGAVFASLLAFAITLINFLALVGSGKEKDFFSLYFERKRLEQQKKIDELKKSMGEKN